MFDTLKFSASCHILKPPPFRKH